MRPLLLIFAMAMGAEAQLPPALPNSQTLSFGMVGLSTNQVARLNAANPAVNPPPGLSRCTVDLFFLDSQGKILKSVNFPIDPGQAVYLDLDRSEIKDEATRVEFRAVVRSSLLPSGVVPPPQEPVSTRCISHFTLEIFDKDTGKTTLILTDSKAVPVPLSPTDTQPPPPGLAR